MDASSSAGLTPLVGTVYFRSAVTVAPISLSVASQHIGDGTRDNPIEVMPGFMGVLGTLSTEGGSRNGPSIFEAITSGSIRLRASQETGILSAIQALPSLTTPTLEEIPVVVRRGSVTATVNVYVRVLPTFNVRVTRPDGTVLSSGDTVTLDMGSQVAQGAVLAFMVPNGGNPTLRVGPNRGYTHALITTRVGYNSNVFEYNIPNNAVRISVVGGLSAGERYTVLMAFGDGGMVDQFGIRQAETRFDVTLFVETSSSIGFGAAVFSHLAGEGTSNRPFIIDEEPDAEVGAELANIAIGGSGGMVTGYSTGPGDITVNSITGGATLNVTRQLVVGQQHEVVVTVDAVGGVMNLLTVHFRVDPFQLRVDVEPAVGFVPPQDLTVCRRANANYCIVNLSPAIQNLQANLFRLQSRGLSGNPTWTLSGPDAAFFEIAPNGNVAQVRANQNLTSNVVAGFLLQRLYTFTVVTELGGQTVETEFRMRVYETQ